MKFIAALGSLNLDSKGSWNKIKLLQYCANIFWIHCGTRTPNNWHLQGCSQDFFRGAHNFCNLPLPPTPNLTCRSTHIDALLCLLLRQAWVKIMCSHFIPFCLLSERMFKYIIQDSNENDFWCGRKSLLFWKILQRIKQLKELRQFILLLLLF